jgi:hypothetical protein
VEAKGKLILTLLTCEGSAIVPDFASINKPFFEILPPYSLLFSGFDPFVPSSFEKKRPFLASWMRLWVNENLKTLYKMFCKMRFDNHKKSPSIEWLFCN